MTTTATTLAGVGAGALVGFLASLFLQRQFRRQDDLAINFTAAMTGGLIGGALAAPPIDEQLTAKTT